MKREKINIILIVIIIILIAIIGVVIFTNSGVIAENDITNNVTNQEENVTQNQEVNEQENALIVDVGNDEIENTIHNIVNDIPAEELIFELPINGATGYAPTTISLLDSAQDGASTITTIKAGEAFTIISEEGNYLYVQYGESLGYLDSTICMINLPDIIPSIVYDDTNSYSSIFKSSGYNLSGITGKQLYDASSYNNRLLQEEYNMPVLYQMAKKIYEAQKLALANNQSLKIYETFRPYEVQMKVSSSLSELEASNETVKNGINVGSWNDSWFIAQTRSNHQLGVAMDVSLVQINSTVEKKAGRYTYTKITDYTEYAMPTSMHELSAAAAAFSYPVSSASKTAWKNVPLASSMTTPAKQLQNYCTSAGMSPLASEWWHFNDLDAKEAIKNKGINGKFYLQDNVSKVPENY